MSKQITIDAVASATVSRKIANGRNRAIVARNGIKGYVAPVSAQDADKHVAVAARKALRDIDTYYRQQAKLDIVEHGAISGKVSHTIVDGVHRASVAQRRVVTVDYVVERSPYIDRQEAQAVLRQTDHTLIRREERLASIDGKARNDARIVRDRDRYDTPKDLSPIGLDLSRDDRILACIGKGRDLITDEVSPRIATLERLDVLREHVRLPCRISTKRKKKNKGRKHRINAMIHSLSK